MAIALSLFAGGGRSSAASAASAHWLNSMRARGDKVRLRRSALAETKAKTTQISIYEKTLTDENAAADDLPDQHDRWDGGLKFRERAAAVDKGFKVQDDFRPELPIERRESAEVLMESMAAAGVENLWFCTGSDLTSLQEAAAKLIALGRPVPRIRTTLHEHVALSIAMGESMMSGRPSAVAAHADLGLLNFGGAIHNAAMGEYPILIISGAPPTTPSQRTDPVYWLQQRWDQGSIVRQYVKWDGRAAPYDDISLTVARALQVALSAPTGPVYLAAPWETLRGTTDRTGPLRLPTQLALSSLGAGGSDDIATIARRLVEAEFPLIVCDRVGRSAAAVGLLEDLAETFAIGVESTRHRMSISDDHFAKSPGYGLAEADVVLVLDAPVPWVPAHRSPGAHAWIAAVGQDPLSLNIPTHDFPAHLRLTVDCSLFLAALLEEMRRIARPSDRERFRRRWQAFQLAAAHDRELRAAMVASVTGTPSIDGLSQALSEVLNPEDILTWEMVDTSGIRRTRPGTLFSSGGASLGWAVGAAIGARIAEPERTAVSLSGDGSFVFGVPTALQWSQEYLDRPVLSIVCNNHAYRTGTSTLRRHYPDGYAVRTSNYEGGAIPNTPDFAGEARANGGYGARVTEASKLREVLVEAKRAVEVENRPAVVDVWVESLA